MGIAPGHPTRRNARFPLYARPELAVWEWYGAR
ncbi:hypothetical protein BX283_8008 [Streptomyces sp. TLI_146]|nr:hypothetical protein BX283_8008 [Streptomyces sp. TLI_146]